MKNLQLLLFAAALLGSVGTSCVRASSRIDEVACDNDADCEPGDKCRSSFFRSEFADYDEYEEDPYAYWEVDYRRFFPDLTKRVGCAPSDFCLSSFSCGTDELCTADRRCRLIECENDYECTPYTCDQVELACRETCSDDLGCSEGHTCVEGECLEDSCDLDVCNGYTCAGTGCRSSCETPVHCTSSHTCIAGACEPLRENGEACANDLECASGHCFAEVYCRPR